MTVILKFPERARPEASEGTLSVAFAAARAILRTMLNRRAARHLADLPDYLLSDIGLRRDDVHEALSADWREDPTFRLAMTASRRRRRS